MNDKLNTLKTLLQKERVSYVLRQNIASSMYSWVNSLAISFFLNHKRNQVGFEGYKIQRDKKTKRQIRDEALHNKVLKIVIANDGQELTKNEVVDKYMEDVRGNDALFIIDALENRRGEYISDQVIMYVSLNEFTLNFTKYNSFLYNVFRDLFTVFKIVAKNNVFDEDEIMASKENRYFFVKEMSQAFIHSLSMEKVRNWDKTQSSLHDIYSKDQDVIKEPLMENKPFVRLADDVLLYLRLITMELYSKMLGRSTLEAKNRVHNLEETIEKMQNEIRNNRIDDEIDEMNDISNVFRGGGE